MIAYLIATYLIGYGVLLADEMKPYEYILSPIIVPIFIGALLGRMLQKITD